MYLILFFIIVMIIGINSYSFGQKEFINVNGKKVEISISGLENNRKDKPVIEFENGKASKYGNWETVIHEVAKTYIARLNSERG